MFKSTLSYSTDPAPFWYAHILYDGEACGCGAVVQAPDESSVRAILAARYRNYPAVTIGTIERKG